MDAKVFTTEKIASLLGVSKWRVVRFGQNADYDITPAYGQATGSGSRRLYNVENVCEIALASWLTDLGLRIAVIARVLTQIRNQGGLTRFLDPKWEQQTLHTFLAIVRKPSSQPKGKITQDAVFIHDWEWLGKTLEKEFYSSALVIDIGRRFWWLSRNSAWGE